MKLIKIIPIFLIPLFVVSCSTKLEDKYVISVHDGDTFTDSKGIKYRLYGVDTPEVSDQYNNFQPTTGIEAIYGNKATQFARDLILKKTCQIERISADKYGRVVARFFYDDKDLAIELLRNGLARVAYISLVPKNPYYTDDYEYYKKLLDAEYEAYDQHLGVWAKINLITKIFPKA